MDAMDAEMVATEDVDSTQTDVDAVDAETEITVGTTAIVRHSAMDSVKDTKKGSEMVSRQEMTMTDSHSRAVALVALEVLEDRAVDAVADATTAMDNDSGNKKRG